MSDKPKVDNSDFFYSGLDKLLYNRYTCINEQYLFMFPHPIPPTPFRPPKGAMLGNKDTAFCFSKLVNFVLKNIIWSKENYIFPFSQHSVVITYII